MSEGASLPRAKTLRSAPALVLTLLLGTVSAHAEPLRLRPAWPDPALQDSIPSLHERLARIDALEDRLLGNPTPDDSLLVDLVRLYRGAPLMKHRVSALQWSEQLPDTVRWREQSLTYRQTYNPWDAEQRLQSWIASSPRGATAHRWLGIHLLEQGIADARYLPRARRAFERARRCADSDFEDTLGLVAVLIAQRDYPALENAADELTRQWPEAPGPWLALGLAREALGLRSSATLAFETAFDRMDPPTRRLFGGEGMRLVYAVENPTKPALGDPPPPPPLRGWWIRLTEAEALFSDPDRGLHGWDTAAGGALLLFGRPRLMRFFENATADEVLVVPEFSRYDDLVQRQIPRTLLSGVQPNSWVWLIDLPSGKSTLLIFQQFTRFARWAPTPMTERRFLDPQRKHGPVGLAASIPTVMSPSDCGLDLLLRGFRVRKREMRIEAWTAIRADSSSGAVAAVAHLLDDRGQEIDRVRKELDAPHARENLRRRFPSLPANGGGWIEGFSFLVGEGTKTVLVEVIDADDRVLVARDASVTLDPDRFTGSLGLDLSDLLPCDVYTEVSSTRGLPPEMVRFAQAVIPHAEPVLHPDQGRLAVYYEVYDAAADSLGRVHLSIEYEVYARRDFDPWTEGPAVIDSHSALPKLRAIFEDETSGTSSSGTVVRGTAVDVSDYPPGEYVLLVRVGDRRHRRETSRTLRFAVPAAAVVHR